MEVPVLEKYMIKATTGTALIINNKEFDGDPERTRHGSDKDVENLERTFKYLNLKVEVKRNLTQFQFILAILNFVEQLGNNEVGVSFVVIMSHGDEDSIETSDNKTVKIEADILNRFANSNCEKMIGKLEVFLFQACRGEEEDPGMFLKTGSRSTATDSVKKVATVLNDSFVASSTIPHHVAYRNRERGSHFIRIVCDVLEKYAHQLHIQDMFVKIQSEMEGIEPNGNQMTPERNNRLKKLLYFQPKCPDESLTRVSNNDFSEPDAGQKKQKKKSKKCNVQ